MSLSNTVWWMWSAYGHELASLKAYGLLAFVDVCLLAAGIFTLVISIVWRAPNLLRDMVVSPSDLTTGLVLGIVLLVTWALSIGAIIQPNHVTKGLMFLNWMLILDTIGVVVIGSFVWFYTLQERIEFHGVFAALDQTTQIAVQDTLKCCGYFNSTDLAVVGGQFCANETFIQQTNNATGNFCVGPITEHADYTLNNIFTSIYGFMAIIILLFLATLA
ncbi:tetraspanin Pls1 family [Phellopilus nigrolimitatus]|nr:tetraspanin Pls1 family [Phellopilus nigrolimitatus]